METAKYAKWGKNVLPPAFAEMLRPGRQRRQTEYLVYHAWDKEMKQRQMCIDRIFWTPDGPRCEGPTYLPHPA